VHAGPSLWGEGRRALCEEEEAALLESLNTGPRQPCYATAFDEKNKKLMPIVTGKMTGLQIK